MTLDLIGLYSDDLVAAMKNSIRAVTGIPTDQVFLACSHTHYGPVVAESGDMPGGGSAQAAGYRELLAAAVAECVGAADAARVPVAVSAGSASVRLGVNRRLPTPDGKVALAPNPAGRVDPELSVVRFDPVTRQPRSAGAARASEASSRVPSAPLLSRRVRVAVPRRGAASVEAAHAELESLQQAAAARDDGDASRWWLELKITEARAVLNALRDGRSPTIDADIAALRIGGVAIAFVPAGLFSELGAMIKERSPAAVTVVVGYTDGALWYVPTRAAFDEGGYEVVDACRVAPGAGEFLVDRVVDLLHELFA